MRRLVPAVCLALLAAAAPVLPVQPRSGEFTGTVRVLEIRVPVEVVDRQGTPVRGLSREHFTLFDDGERREIIAFEVVDRDRATAERSTPVALASVARRHILLLFDLTYADPLSIGKARRAAREVVLGALHPTDLVAVATYSVEHGPTLLLTFTPDRAQVARAIDGLSFDRTGERATLDPLRFLLAPSASASQGVAVGDRAGRGSEVRAELEAILIESQEIAARRAERQEQEYSRTRALTWTRDLERLARTLAEVPGRKQVVLLSEGFDSQLLMGRRDLGSDEAREEQARTISGGQWEVDNTTRFGDITLRNHAERLIAELGRADCVVQAVDIGGLRTEGDIRAVAHSAGEDTLFYFANETGGELLQNANDLPAQLGRALRRSAVTYLLTFRATDLEAAGSFRRLRVRVEDLPRGATVAHRTGYYVPRPFPELDPLERDLLAADAIASAAPRDEIAVEVLAASFRSGGVHAYVPVILEVDGEDLFPARGGEPVRLELYAYASNARGEMEGFFSRAIALTAGPELRGKAGFKYYGHLELPTGEHLVRVLVRDLASGRVGVATAAVDVPDFQSDPAVLLDPFFFDRPERWVLAREEPAADGGDMVVYPFVVDGTPYVPQTTPATKRGGVARFCLVGYNLPGELTASGRLVRGDGSPAADEAITLTRSPSGIEGLQRWTGVVETAALQPGAHRVELTLTGSTGDGRWTADASLCVAGAGSACETGTAKP